MAKHHVIYVPGLLDQLKINSLQKNAFLGWRSGSVQPHYFAARWSDTQETYNAKLTRLLKLIDGIDGPLALVGASAGSSLILTAFAKRKDKVSAAISICGKLYHPEKVAPEVFATSPAFKESILAYLAIEPDLTKTDRKKILLVQAKHDSYVPTADGRVQGAHTTQILSIGHVTSIFLTLTLYRRRLVSFIKQS